MVLDKPQFPSPEGRFRGRDHPNAHIPTEQPGLAAAPSVLGLSGSADWLSTDHAEKRVGTLHALGNVAATTLFAASWLLRWRGAHRSGVVASIVASGLVGAAGYLGGHLAYRRGVGVNTTAFQSGPDDWTEVADRADLTFNQPIAVSADGVSILVVAHGPSVDQIRVLENRCSHRGAPLHEGTLADSCIECPWHGSQFALDDGHVIKGPASMPQPSLDVRVRNSRVEVRRIDDHVALRANTISATATP